MPDPVISVIIPAYNAEKYLAATLDSVLSQTFPDWECIVVDDGSNDSTAAIAQSYANKDSRFRVVLQPNGGVATARNQGYAQSALGSAYIGFLDSDDAYLPDALEILSTTLNVNPDIVAIHGYCELMDAKGNVTANEGYRQAQRSRLCLINDRVVRSPIEMPTTFAMLVTNCPIITPGLVLIRREALQKVGLFEQSVACAADWDMWVRLGRLSDLYFVDKPVMLYRRHDSNMSASRHKMVGATASVRKRIAYSSENTPEQRRLALRAYQKFYWFMSRERYGTVLSLLRQGKIKPALHWLGMSMINFLMGLHGKP